MTNFEKYKQIREALAEGKSFSWIVANLHVSNGTIVRAKQMTENEVEAGVSHNEEPVMKEEIETEIKLSMKTYTELCKMQTSKALSGKQRRAIKELLDKIYKMVKLE